MEQPDVHLLSGAYAAGAVDDLERVAFERHLAQCTDCRTEVRELRETLVRLAEGAAVTPPEGLKQQITAQLRRTAQAGRAEPAAAAPRRRAARTPWLVAAGFAVLTAGAGAVAVDQYRVAEQARELAVVVADPTATRSTARAVPAGQVMLVVAGARAAVVTAAMPALPSGRSYQLWIVRPGRTASAGLGPAAGSAAGSWSRLLDGVRPGDVIAISVEPSAGSQQPTTTPVVTLPA